MDERNLAALVERVLGGETRAYEAVFLATKDGMYFHAKTILQSEEAAWDAVQDAYIAAFRSLEKLKTPSTADIWLCAIAANICFSRLKKRAAAMKYDRRTGRYVLFEINPRLGRSSYFCRAAGLNMMKLLTDDVVYGKREECVYNHTVSLWQNVPDGILRRYVKDPALAEELRTLKGTHTLFCRGDLPPARLYRLLRYYAAQYRNFRNYYFEKK